MVLANGGLFILDGNSNINQRKRDNKLQDKEVSKEVEQRGIDVTGMTEKKDTRIKINGKEQRRWLKVNYQGHA